MNEKMKLNMKFRLCARGEFFLLNLKKKKSMLGIVWMLLIIRLIMILLLTTVTAIVFLHYIGRDAGIQILVALTD